MRVVYLALPFLACAAEPTFEVRGRVTPPARAFVSLHAVADAFAVNAEVGAGGEFRFKKIRSGSYTLAISVIGRGEIRNTIDVGPATADHRGRVHIEIDRYSAYINTDRLASVTAVELSVPDAARREYAAASKRLAERDEAGARAHYLRAVELAPQFAAAWNNLGTMAYKTGDLASAETYFRRALEADPESYEPLVNLGGVLVSMGRIGEGRELNSSAVARKPKDPLAHAQLGMTYLRMNWLIPAEAHLKIAASLDPKHFSLPQLSLAEVYVRMNRKLSAAEQLSELLRQHPDRPDQAKVRETIELWSSPSH